MNKEKEMLVTIVFKRGENPIYPMATSAEGYASKDILSDMNNKTFIELREEREDGTGRTYILPVHSISHVYHSRVTKATRCISEEEMFAAASDVIAVDDDEF